MRGTVEHFDEAVGLGTVSTDGGAQFRFHCTQIADGTRTIPEGIPVEFEVRPGHRGHWEAAAVRAVQAPPV